MGIARIVAAGLLALAPLPFLAQAQAADPLAQAESLLQKQQYTQAEAALNAVMGQQSQNPQAWFDLGFARSHLGNNSGAADAYAKAVQLSPRWFEANLNLGLSLARDGQKAEAVAPLKKATELKPTTGGNKALGQAWDALGAALEESDPKAALVAFQKAGELNPANPPAPMILGRLKERAGDVVGAEQSYLKAAAAGDEQAIAVLADLYLRQKRLPEAETWLRKELGRNPAEDTRLALARVLEAEAMPKEAIDVLQSASPSAQADLRRELAGLYLDQKQYPSAAALLSVLVQEMPKDAVLHMQLGQALLYQLKYAAAEGELRKAIQLKPELTEAYSYLADAAQQNKDYQLVIVTLDARAKLLPETPATYWLRATAYDSLHASRQAAENYKLFLAAAAGRFPDQEFKAQHRLLAIEPKK